MSISLPPPIAAYFAADAAKDADAVARCFATDGVVRDEGRSHVGQDTIRAWNLAAGSHYTYAVEPLDLAMDNAQTVVTGRVTGTFPGSPILLRYRFALVGPFIATLEILP